jgi:hypothetical protein
MRCNFSGSYENLSYRYGPGTIEQFMVLGRRRVALPFSSNVILELIFRVAHPLRFSAKGGKRQRWRLLRVSLKEPIPVNLPQSRMANSCVAGTLKKTSQSTEEKIDVFERVKPRRVKISTCPNQVPDLARQFFDIFSLLDQGKR